MCAVYLFVICYPALFVLLINDFLFLVDILSKVLIYIYCYFYKTDGSGMPEGKEEIYSIMFSSLKHPVRRKILRVLADKPLAFSDMLDLLGISSSNLTYHLDSLGELVSKDEIGVYHLSTFGQASVGTMKIVEEAPQVQPKKRNGKTRKWQMLAGILLICVVLLAGVSALQINTANQLVQREIICSRSITSFYLGQAQQMTQ